MSVPPPPRILPQEGLCVPSQIFLRPGVTPDRQTCVPSITWCYALCLQCCQLV